MANTGWSKDLQKSVNAHKMARELAGIDTQEFTNNIDWGKSTSVINRRGSWFEKAHSSTTTR